MKIAIQTADTDAIVDLNCVQSIIRTDLGIEIYMYDPNSSLVFDVPPADGKAIFARLHRAIFGNNEETNQLILQLERQNG